MRDHGRVLLAATIEDLAVLNHFHGGFCACRSDGFNRPNKALSISLPQEVVISLQHLACSGNALGGVESSYKARPSNAFVL